MMTILLSYCMQFIASSTIPAILEIKDPPIPEINEIKKPNSVVDLVAEGKNNSQTTISTLLPLFLDDSKSVVMIKHSMDNVRKSVSILNQGQTSVIACDQPLYKIATDIQWAWPEAYGGDSYGVVLRGRGWLHIKISLMKCLRDVLDGSGWTSAISQAEVANPGTADSFSRFSM